MIEWARAQLQRRSPETADCVAAGLADELRHHKERYGRVVLPDVVPEQYLAPPAPE